MDETAYEWETFKKEDYSSIIDVAIMSEQAAPCKWETFNKEDYCHHEQAKKT